MKKVLIMGKLPTIAKEILQSAFEVDLLEGKSTSEQDKIEIVQTYDAVLSTIYDHFSKEILEQSKRLKVISNYAIGLDNIDVAYARHKGIAVYNLPDIVTNSTADLTFALLLSFLRQICQASEYVRQGKWTEPSIDLFHGEELFGKTLGIVGFGRIGKAVAKRAFGFGLNILTFSRSKDAVPEEYQSFVSQVSFEKLLASSDYISLHVPLTEQTKGMIMLDVMRKMNKRPLLLNLGRGAVINTTDLVFALEQKLIRGVALDVTDPEPLPGDHPLLKYQNCLIVPHIGTATQECRFSMAKKAAKNILDHFHEE